MIRTFCYKLKPTKTQVLWFEDILERLRQLQNSALNGRKAVYETEGRTLGFSEQCQELTVARRQDTYYLEVPAQFQQSVLKRVDKSFKGFFCRVRAGESLGILDFGVATVLSRGVSSRISMETASNLYGIRTSVMLG